MQVLMRLIICVLIFLPSCYFGCMSSEKNSQQPERVLNITIDDVSGVEGLSDYTVMRGHHCGGENIYLWGDGSSTNYGTVGELSICSSTCSSHDECAAFIFYDNICAFWARAPLNPYRSDSADCYIKSKGGQLYLCDYKHCLWDDYTENEDWGHYSKNNSDCQFCQSKCDDDPNCSGVECGGKIDYCAWWKLTKCVTSDEKNIDDTYHTTCTKIQFAIMLDTQTDSDAPNKNSSSVATPDTRKDSGCCKIISVSSRFKREGDRPEDEIFVLQKEFPRIYENSAGDKITRYGGLCYKKEEQGYWMVRKSYRIPQSSSLPTWKWIDIYPTKERNDSSIKINNNLSNTHNITNQECEWYNMEMCSTEVERNCRILCNKECPESCSEGGFLATVMGRDYNTYDREWDPNLNISCV